MNDITVSTAQFENKSADKAYNLAVIDRLSQKASLEGSDVITFHECCISGYTFARNLSKSQMLDIAELIPEGESTGALIDIARKDDITILAGLFEKDGADRLFNTYIGVDKNGLIAKHRKLHPFIHPDLTPGDSYCLFNIQGWSCGILTCYDNNIVENVRATRLLGADILFMPHVTMCTPSTRPAAGFVDPELWRNRLSDPTSLRLEFDGMKGRQWLMKWLPARAYDNGMYVVFSNPIGMDEDQLKNGCAMIIDPFGDILAECRLLDDTFVSATINHEKIGRSGGSRYLNARRPELYKAILGQDHQPTQKVSWLAKRKD
jgi:predicted amidohydrolase